jgi:hypothetical protein
LLGGGDALFDEFDQDSVFAEGALLRDRVHLFCDSWWQRYTAADLTGAGSLGGWHGDTSLHQTGAYT